MFPLQSSKSAIHFVVLSVSKPHRRFLNVPQDSCMLPSVPPSPHTALHADTGRCRRDSDRSGSIFQRNQMDTSIWTLTAGPVRDRCAEFNFTWYEFESCLGSDTSNNVSPLENKQNCNNKLLLNGGGIFHSSSSWLTSQRPPFRHKPWQLLFPGNEKHDYLINLSRKMRFWQNHKSVNNAEKRQTMTDIIKSDLNRIVFLCTMQRLHFYINIWSSFISENKPPLSLIVYLFLS